MDYPDGSNLVPWRWKQRDLYMSKSGAAILNPPNLLCLFIDAQSDPELLRGSRDHLRLRCRLMLPSRLGPFTQVVQVTE